MTVISFQGRFAEAVDARTKTQTIRAGKRQWRVGQTLHLYSGGYRKGEKRRKLGGDENPKVVKVKEILIVHQDDPDFRYNVIVGSTGLLPTAVAALATADGFRSIGAFLDYFVPRRGDVFSGHIIHWDWP
jgi:hypothetical protein